MEINVYMVKKSSHLLWNMVSIRELVDFPEQVNTVNVKSGIFHFLSSPRHATPRHAERSASEPRHKARNLTYPRLT